MLRSPETLLQEFWRMGLPLRDSRHHNYGECSSWPDDTRCELIDGRAYAMGSAPVQIHQELVGGVVRQVADALEGGPCRVYIAPFDVRLPWASHRGR